MPTHYWFNCHIFGGIRLPDKRVSVDVKVGGEHLRLFSEQNGLVVLASVYDLTARRRVAPSELVIMISATANNEQRHMPKHI